MFLEQGYAGTHARHPAESLAARQLRIIKPSMSLKSQVTSPLQADIGVTVDDRSGVRCDSENVPI